MDYLNDPVEDLLKAQKKPKDRTPQDILDEIIRADMELMLKEYSVEELTGRLKAPEFPDPVEPQWKN